MDRHPKLWLTRFPTSVRDVAAAGVPQSGIKAVDQGYLVE
jgi:hypothetical protein